MMIHDFFLVFLLNHVLLDNKAGFPLANIFAQSDFFPLSLSFRLKPSGTNYVETKEKSRFARKYLLVENRLNLSQAFSSPCLWSYLLDVNSNFKYIFGFRRALIALLRCKRYVFEAHPRHFFTYFFKVFFQSLVF